MVSLTPYAFSCNDVSKLEVGDKSTLYFFPLPCKLKIVALVTVNESNVIDCNSLLEKILYVTTESFVVELFAKTLDKLIDGFVKS